jgi:regulator of cell morphogenesis and NO signaling
MESFQTLEAAHCGSVQNPINVMEHEHDAAGAALERMRMLTNEFTPPEDGCNTYRAMLDGLAELEADLHLHIHKENNILFPRAIAVESDLGRKE